MKINMKRITLLLLLVFFASFASYANAVSISGFFKGEAFDKNEPAEAMNITLNNMKSESGSALVVYGEKAPKEEVSNAQLVASYLTGRGINATAMPDSAMNSSFYSKNSVILLGGPCANKESEEVFFMGRLVPSCTYGFKKDSFLAISMRRMGKLHLLLAGYSVEDTAMAVVYLLNA